MLFVVKPRLPKKRVASGGRSKGRKSKSRGRRHGGEGAEDVSIEDLGGLLAGYASEEEMKRELDRMRAEHDEDLDQGFAKPADVITRRTRRRLSDFAGILSPESTQELREAIDESRKERERLDRKRLKRLLEAFDRSDDAAVLETARRKAKSAGLTRKKVRELVNQVKKEVWNRTYGDKKPRK